MVKQKIPTFDQIKDWAASKTALTNHEGASNPHSGSLSTSYNAPIQSVNGETGSINVSSSLFGSGSDGSINRSANLTEEKIINATDYTLQSGVTATVDNMVAIFATESIQISGTIDATGESTYPDGDIDGIFSPEVAGGAAGNGYDYGGAGQDGGDGDIYLPKNIDLLQAGLFDVLRESQKNGTSFAAQGGRGGEGREDLQDSTNSGGSDGSFPGGGGGGGDNQYGYGNDAKGGNGGAGGGLILLSAPEVTVDGTLISDGNDGGDGGVDEGMGGGGGGGAGGIIILMGQTINNTATISLTGGAGGIGGSDNGVKAGDGAKGADGIIKEITY